ncbi:hypothetical protein L1885_01385 [Streptomyces fuscigenes]|nr:hypothetical protein [Streptomyces fuscigenes]
MREAAKRAGMSDARWRQISSGYQTVSGEQIPVTGPAETVARMSQVVGVTAEELQRAGRDDAAAALEEITPLPQPDTASAFSPPVDAVYQLLAALPPEAQDEVLRRLAREHPNAAQPFDAQEHHAG